MTSNFNPSDIHVIAFDADDTLWDCQSYYETVESNLHSLISPYCDNPSQELFATESANMSDLGYGSKAFTISVMETALRVGGDHLSSNDLKGLMDSCRTLLHIPATPLPEVEDTLRRLHESGRWRLAVFTKGELQDQEQKLRRSGLLPYFSDAEIVANKTEETFKRLCKHTEISPSQLLMVGNSLKSDIAPALAIGAFAVHIPFYVTWQMEHAEHIQHDRMTEISRMGELLDIMGV